MLSASVLVAVADQSGFARAKDIYYKGIYGNKNAKEEADKLFSALYGQSPNDPLIRVYYGSLRLLEAERTWALWRKNSLSKEGVALMDSAVAAAPQNPEVRFVRGATERELPGFFGRKQQSKEDLANVVQDASLSKLEPRLAAASLYYFGLDCEESGNHPRAVDAWKKAAQRAPESHAGQAAAKKLKALP